MRDRALSAFEALARAEARAQGVAEEAVRFRPVEAVDSIVGFLGCALALDLLQVQTVSCGPIPVGLGEAGEDPTRPPSPSPSTLELLRGVPIVGMELGFETVPPTGAALVRTLAASFGPAPSMTLRRAGVGFGSQEPAHRPHCLQVLVGTVGKTGGVHRPLTLLETNLDDLSAEILATLIEECMAAGALDAWLTPVLMKKGRPAHTLAALCPPDRVDELEGVIFQHTSTLGLRRSAVDRVSLERHWEQVETPWGSVRVKVGSRDGRPLNRAPEFEDCRAAAERAGIPLKEVYAAALKALPQA